VTESSRFPDSSMVLISQSSGSLAGGRLISTPLQNSRRWTVSCAVAEDDPEDDVDDTEVREVDEAPILGVDGSRT
jgi:hypothetical protein